MRHRRLRMRLLVLQQLNDLGPAQRPHLLAIEALCALAAPALHKREGKDGVDADDVGHMGQVGDLFWEGRRVSMRLYHSKKMAKQRE